MPVNLKNVHPTALKALEKAFKEANIRPVIVQILGHAFASKGTHDQAGTYRNLLGLKTPFSVCIDISVNQKATRISDKKKITMDKTRIKWLLYNLAKNGFVAWLRTTAQGFDPHIHLVCAMLPLSGIPEGQVLSFLRDKTGLASNKEETFWTADDELDKYIAQVFMKANPESIPKVPSKYRL